MELFVQLGRVVLSLVVVLVLLWVAARVLRKNQRRSMQGVEVDVLARQPLAQRASVAVVQVGDRALVLGVTENRVELLSEAPLASVLTASSLVEPPTPDAEDEAPTSPASSASPANPVTLVHQRKPAAVGGIAGSALSPATWAKALDAVREMTVRR
ncbi:MAG TPA: flagellar biosynthetic protein FliO [Angustibacter sp.]|nr:flagellar biosynthetic protein FliO [Angustibacter sp.]